jgi:hypothetical protein
MSRSCFTANSFAGYFCSHPHVAGNWKRQGCRHGGRRGHCMQRPQWMWSIFWLWVICKCWLLCRVGFLPLGSGKFSGAVSGIGNAMRIFGFFVWGQIGSWVGNKVGIKIYRKQKGPSFFTQPFDFIWRATRELNPGPLVPETNALSTELVAPKNSAE